MFLKTYGWSFLVTAVALAGAFLLGGWSAFGLVAILSILEISLSFDNAVINATVLERMSPFWQRIFLTIGILIAVFGMRLLFPLLIVASTASINPVEVVRLALDGGSIDEPGTYAYLLHEAHPSIAAFGGVFLLMIFLDFVFEDRDIRWLSWLERPLARIGKLDQLSVIVTLTALVLAAEFLAKDPGKVMIAGVLGLGTYLLVNALSDLFESAGEVDEDDIAEQGPVDAAAGEVAAVESGRKPLTVVVGKAAFFLFLYLEVLDASFSFDGVIGAFAITQDIFIIATGLGVGAMYIRSITIYLVRKGTLSEYRYLEHGAHWAIGALAGILLVSIRHEVPEIVTGLIGVGFIGAAFVGSILKNRSERGGDGDEVSAEDATVAVG